MKLYSEGKNYKLYHGNMLDMLEVIAPNSIEAVVTDPPYELGFMNKGWDSSGIAFQKETWEKCLTVLKPGGYLLAFGGSRTFHRIACAIEDAGFEIRDTIMFLYGSGFPKSLNIGLAIDKKNGIESEVISEADFPDIRANNYENNDGTRIIVQKKQAQNEWDGWGTALKPAYEPIIVARKPCEGSCVDNVLAYGVGGINIDECRIPFVSEQDYKITADKNQHETFGTKPLTDNLVYGDYSMVQPKNYQSDGRYPANVILSYDDTDKDEVIGGMPYTESNGGASSMPDFQDAGKKNVANGGMNKIGYNAGETAERKQSTYVAPIDSGSAARYFYCAKASPQDRDEGLEDFELQRKAGYGYDRGYMDAGEGMFKDRQTAKRNTHPTVKPCELMKYLVRLVTPNGGTVLDPFNGSGSTGKAVIYESREHSKNYKYIGIEITEEYLPISEARIAFAENKPMQYKLF